jgi:hypothetical protein
MSDSIPDGGGFDDEQLAAESMNTVTNDAVAGETVYPGAGDGNDGPTGGAPGEGEPYEEDNDLEGEEIVGLDDEGPSGPVTVSHE